MSLKFHILAILERAPAPVKYTDLRKKIPGGFCKSSATMAKAVSELVEAGQVVIVPGYGKQTKMYQLGKQDAKDNASWQKEAGQLEAATPQDIKAATQAGAQSFDALVARSMSRSARSLFGGFEQV